MIPRLLVSLLVLTLPGCPRTEAQGSPRAEVRTADPPLLIFGDSPRTVQSGSRPENLPRGPARAESVMRALSRAYPDRLGPAEFVDGDWTVLLDGVRYFYAEGRLLPENLRDRASEYDPQPFYFYPKKLDDWAAPDAAEVARLRAITAGREQAPPRRSQHFLDALWRSRDKAESYDRVKTILFFKHEVMVHYSLLDDLALVEERIREASKTDRSVRAWIAGLGSLTGWNWRTIADTKSRSYHSYGAAVDILPARDDGLATYWLWSAESIKDWWNIPYAKRRHPPEAVLEAFESQGFVWGGKWRLFDTMHFEYRPEILILNGLR